MMEIGPLSNHQAGQGPEAPDSRKQENPPAGPDGKISDQVVISQEARAMLGELADQELRKQQEEPRPVGTQGQTGQNRLALIRQRIESGFYNRPEVINRIVDKLIDDRDI